MREVRINFGLSDLWVQSLVLAIRWPIAETKLKNQLHFSLIFGLSRYFGLSSVLSERLIQKVKSPNVLSET